MRLGGDPDLGHLTYCTNIHPGEDWPDLSAALRKYLPIVKREFAPKASMGVGLRLAATAAEALEDPATLDELRALLTEHDCYVFTLNGFPFGAFHGQPVKEEAYRPDWAESVRLRYSNRLANVLAALLPDGIDGTVSTVPGTFRPWASGRIDAITENLLRHAAHLVALRETTGRTISLTLEPEPCCLLETISETIAFFEDHLLSADAEIRLASLTGLSRAASGDALRRHLGVCYDVCHAAVEFEDPDASIRAIRDAGIAIGKVQLSAALKIPRVTRETPALLAPFDEPVYLHQVVARRDGALTRYLDLPQAFDALSDADDGSEWRVHFHVPIFLEELEHFSTTRDFLDAVLAIHRRSPIAPHLEVETYTWDVLPDQYRDVGLGTAIARELNWARNTLCA